METLCCLPWPNVLSYIWIFGSVEKTQSNLVRVTIAALSNRCAAAHMTKIQNDSFDTCVECTVC